MESISAAATYDDIALVPRNEMHSRLEAFVSPEEKATLESLRAAYERARAAVQAARGCPGDVQKLRMDAREAFERYDDCIAQLTWQYPHAEPVESRDEIDLRPRRLGKVPVIIGDSYLLSLRAVREAARCSITGTVMRLQDVERMDQNLGRYKQEMARADPLYRECCVLTPDATLAEYNLYVQKYPHDFAVIVEGTRDRFDRNGRFLGFVTPREVAKAQGYDGTPMSKIHRPRQEALQAAVGIGPRDVVRFFDERGIHDSQAILTITDNDHVAGIVSKGDAAFALRFRPHLHAVRGERSLGYLVAISPKHTPVGLISRWIADRMLGVGIVLDRAHLDRGCRIYHYIESVRAAIDDLDPSLEFIVGNLATGGAALRAARAGAKGVRVGVGPGAICTTRVISGFGVPQFEAVREVKQALDDHGFDDVLVHADGGLTVPGDFVKARVGGADHGVAVTMFVQTRESSPEIQQFSKPLEQWKIWNGGNASGPVQQVQMPREDETDREIYRRVRGPRIEGAADYMPMRTEYQTVRGAVEWVTDGMSSGVSYGGEDRWVDLKGVEVRQQTDAGRREGDSRLG